MVNARFPRAGAAALGAFLSLAGHAIAAELPKPATFAKEVAPILQAKCESCHRKGTSAPMSLVTYAETRPWAKAIRDAVRTRKMPPWFADPCCGHFSNDRSLTPAEIATLSEWAETGAAKAMDRRPAYEPPPFFETAATPPPQQILSRSTVSAVESAFNSLANTVLSNNARTLEDLVKEMLRPMLKSWLDDNLPGLVERIVKAEIERVSRGR